MMTVTSTEHLCGVCENKDNFPECMAEDVQFGDGYGNDNVVHCANYPPADRSAEERLTSHNK